MPRSARNCGPQSVWLTPLSFASIICPMKTVIKLPHPDDIAARKALAARPQQSLEKVLEQARASEEWRRSNGFANGRKKPGV